MTRSLPPPEGVEASSRRTAELLSLRQCPQERVVSLDARRPGLLGERACPRSMPHSLAQRFVAEERDGRGRRFLGIIRLDDETRLALPDGFRQTGPGGNDRREAAKRSLDHGDPEPFDVAGAGLTACENEDIRGIEDT